MNQSSYLHRNLENLKLKTLGKENLVKTFFLTVYLYKKNKKKLSKKLLTYKKKTLRPQGG